jgi:hypothetical protein
MRGQGSLQELLGKRRSTAQPQAAAEGAYLRCAGLRCARLIARRACRADTQACGIQATIPAVSAIVLRARAPGPGAPAPRAWARIRSACGRSRRAGLPPGPQPRTRTQHACGCRHTPGRCWCARGSADRSLAAVLPGGGAQAPGSARWPGQAPAGRGRIRRAAAPATGAGQRSGPQRRAGKPWCSPGQNAPCPPPPPCHLAARQPPVGGSSPLARAVELTAACRCPLRGLWWACRCSWQAAGAAPR